MILYLKAMDVIYHLAISSYLRDAMRDWVVENTKSPFWYFWDDAVGYAFYFSDPHEAFMFQLSNRFN